MKDLLVEEERRPQQQVPWPVTNSWNIGENYGEGPQIKVRAIRMIYYNFNRRREGDVFTLIPQWVTVTDPKTGRPVKEKGDIKKRLVTAEEQFSEETMERVDPEVVETLSTAQQALNKAQDELDEAKRPTKGR